MIFILICKNNLNLEMMFFKQETIIFVSKKSNKQFPILKLNLKISILKNVKTLMDFK